MWAWDKLLAIGLILAVATLLVYLIILIHKKTTKFSFEPKEIPKFSVDVQYDPYPSTIDINNKYDCTADSLRKCDINDSTTLFGCKELIVRCHHFDKDTEYVNNNETKIIPKNSTPTEGYALAITTIVDSCNPYHGDLTLVTTNDDSNEYMLICSCKNPGYIGNDNILGNCTTVFICNGQIDDIDKNLNDINCKCSEREISMRYEDGLPVCKSMTVKDANERFDDWSHLVPFNSNRQIDSNKYNVTISGNLKTSRLLDPCQNSIHDTSIEIINGKFDSINGRCVVLDYGLPLSTGLLDHHPEDDTVKIESVSSDCVLATEKYLKARVSDNIAGVRRVNALTVAGLPFAQDLQNTTVVVVPKHGMSFGKNGQMSITANPDIFNSCRCSGDWPNYSCYVLQYFDHIEDNLTFPGHRLCPSSFFWGQELWNNSEFLVYNGVKFNRNGLYFDNDAWRKISSILPYGIQWSSGADSIDSGILSFASPDDFKKHREVMT